jgi:hypothetical protein
MGRGLIRAILSRDGIGLLGRSWLLLIGRLLVSWCLFFFEVCMEGGADVFFFSFRGKILDI